MQAHDQESEKRFDADAALHLLAAERRRQTLHVLATRGANDSAGIAEIIGPEGDEQLRQLHLTLSHVTLPKLAYYGAIEHHNNCYAIADKGRKLLDMWDAIAEQLRD